MNKKVIIGIISGVVLLGVCGICILGGGFVALLGNSEAEAKQASSQEIAPEDSSLRGQAIQAADGFMVALKANDYAQAFNLSTLELQAELESPESLQSLLQSNNLSVADWEWTNRTLDLQNNVMIMDGNALFGDGRSGVVNLELIQIDGIWQIYFLNLQPQ